MDGGLGVGWPLSPYATALAAGALFACCVTIWKYRSIKSEAGRKPDLDPNEDKNEPGKERGEKGAGRGKNFPVLALRETQRVFNYEHLGLPGQFGAIPRTTRRRQSVENNILPVLQRRGRNNWHQDLNNPASVILSRLPQHPFGLGSGFGLNPGLFFGATHNLHAYFGRFEGESSTPGTTRNSDRFDVSIRPEILKNKPITRSALCLALQNQLRKFLEEPFRELRLTDRAVQTAEGVQSPPDFSSNEISERGSELPDGSSAKNCKAPLSAVSSLWDSGYGEKVFEESSEGHGRCESTDPPTDGSSGLCPDVVTDIGPEPEGGNLRKLSDSSREESSDETVVIVESEPSDSTNVESDSETELGEENIGGIVTEEEEIIFLEDQDLEGDLSGFCDPHPDSGRESLLSSDWGGPESPQSSDLDAIQENVFRDPKSEEKTIPDDPIAEKSTGVDDFSSSSGLDRFQRSFGEECGETAAPPGEESSEEGAGGSGARYVTEGGASRDSPAFDERGTFNSPRQMDRETGERSVAVESTVTTEATYGEGRLSTAVVSRLTLEHWLDPDSSLSVKTSVSEDFAPLGRIEEEIPVNGNATREFAVHPGELPPSPRVDRLKGLLCRDEERRARSKFHHEDGGAMEGEWDRLLRDVLASVSELERWERRHRDVSGDAEDAEHQQQHPSSQSDSSFAMEEEALSPKGGTPTKVKSLRFKLDPDIFDVPSDDSFYDDDDEDECRRSWKKQTKYRAFSSLELDDEPVRLVSVHASVVPPGQKMVARPVGIDLRVRLTEERQSKRAHVSTSPSQAKRRSPVSDRGWCQELSPVTENVDWRETFTPVATPETKSVRNGILKTPSPKIEPSPIESPNPFKMENGVTTNGVTPENKPEPKQNGWKPPEKKPFLLLPRKKFEPDPEAIERITGYRSALSKPPLPPPVPSKANASIILKSRAEQARKQYLDNKNALSSGKGDGMKKFQQFLNQAQNDRARIVTSVPDLAAIERAVTEQWTKERASVSPRESPVREDIVKTDAVTSSCGTTPDDKWSSYVQSCRKHLGRRSQSMSYLETDIDVIPILDDDKCQSVTALDEPDEALPDPDDSDLDGSREDLDDSGRAKSEHELRIERSLRSLPVPDWYRRSEKTKTGFLLGSSSKEKRGWAAAKSLASSTSSLASCGLRRPVRSLRSSRENIPWSRSSASPDGPTLSLALAKAFREPYLGWRARTPTSSGVSSSPRASPPSWGATTTDDEANGVSFDGEDAFGRTTSSEEDRRDEPLSLDDTGADAVTVSMDTNDPVKLPGGEDTCDDINNMSMDTCELFDASVVVPVDEDPSPQADTGDDIDNLSTDTTTTEGRKLDPKLKRYSYSQSIYHSEWDEDEESRGDRKGKEEEDREQSPSSPDHKVVWIESSFVGSRTTTSIVVLPEKKAAQNRPASR